MRSLKWVFVSIAVSVTSLPAAAQKSADTLRVSINDMFGTVDPYHFVIDESGQFSRTVYNALVEYDQYKGIFVPSLAKSYKRVDNKTLEFELRDGVKFHNGKAFDASDVKATFDYASDPKVSLQFKSRFDWVKEVEILSPYKIRVHANRLNATDLANVAYHLRILDGAALNKLENKSDYGRVSPVGTGQYKIAYVDRNKGVLVERFDAFFDGKPYYRAPVARVQGIPMPDRQTQNAQLITGGVDLLRNITGDDATSLAKNPNLAVSYTGSGQILYMTMDAAGRSSVKIMTDERVRKAIIMAIDRVTLVHNLLPDGKSAEIIDGVCLKSTENCVPSTKPYAYDPVQAQRLLGEAGYGDGFDLTLYAFQPFAYFAQAIAGELRKVGIRASIEPMPLSVYSKRRGNGELTTFVGMYATGGLPMMSNIMDIFFGGDRDYSNDPSLQKALELGAMEYDSDARNRIYGPALDLINEKAYIFPISEIPLAWAHSKDVKLLPNTFSTLTPRLGDYAWSDYKD